jgi:hypothetical protein
MDCDGLIDADFMALVTGVTITEEQTDKFNTLNDLVAGMVAEIVYGPDTTVCVTNPSNSMKVAIAQFMAPVMVLTPAAPSPNPIKSEAIGDYRVEYRDSSGGDLLDIRVLRRLLAKGSSRNGTIHTIDELQPATDDEWWNLEVDLEGS